MNQKDDWPVLFRAGLKMSPERRAKWASWKYLVLKHPDRYKIKFNVEYKCFGSMHTLSEIKSLDVEPWPLNIIAKWWLGSISYPQVIDWIGGGKPDDKESKLVNPLKVDWIKI
jgi:hypothetical protein